MTTKLDTLLMTRACRYGAFEDVAQRTNNIYASILQNAPQLASTQPHHREALHNIAQKLARLVEGQINDADGWLDIAGYAMLVHNHISPQETASESASPFSNPAAMKAMEEKIAAEMSGQT